MIFSERQITKQLLLYYLIHVGNVSTYPLVIFNKQYKYNIKKSFALLSNTFSFRSRSVSVNRCHFVDANLFDSFLLICIYVRFDIFRHIHRYVYISIFLSPSSFFFWTSFPQFSVAIIIPLWIHSRVILFCSIKIPITEHRIYHSSLLVTSRGRIINTPCELIQILVFLSNPSGLTNIWWIGVIGWDRKLTRSV